MYRFKVHGGFQILFFIVNVIQQEIFQRTAHYHEFNEYLKKEIILLKIKKN